MTFRQQLIPLYNALKDERGFVANIIRAGYVPDQVTFSAWVSYVCERCEIEIGEEFLTDSVYRTMIIKSILSKVSYKRKKLKRVTMLFIRDCEGEVEKAKLKQKFKKEIDRV